MLCGRFCTVPMTVRPMPVVRRSGLDHVHICRRAVFGHCKARHMDRPVFAKFIYKATNNLDPELLHHRAPHICRQSKPHESTTWRTALHVVCLSVGCAHLSGAGPAVDVLEGPAPRLTPLQRRPRYHCLIADVFEPWQRAAFCSLIAAHDTKPASWHRLRSVVASKGAFLPS